MSKDSPAPSDKGKRPGKTGRQDRETGSDSGGFTRNKKDGSAPPRRKEGSGERRTSGEQAGEERTTHDDSARESRAREYKPRESGPREYKSRGDKPREYKSREGGPREGKSRDDKPREYKSREGGPYDGKSRDDKPREYKPREGGPREGKSRDDKPREYKPREYKSRDEKPGERKPREYKPRDGQPRDENAPQRPRRKEDGEQSKRPDGAGKFDRPKKEWKSRDAGATGSDAGRAARPPRKEDTRPFRKRQAPSETGGDAKPSKSRAKREATSSEPLENKGFGSVLNKAFYPPKKKDENDPGKRQVFEDKVFGELTDPVTEVAKPFANKKTAPAKPQATDGIKRKRVKEEPSEKGDKKKEASEAEMPLNKYIAHSGECSRRDAAELVKQGKVKVNGELVLDPGYKVLADDKVTLSGKKLTPQKGLVYILLNKPKGFITTNDDPQGRKTVMDLVQNAEIDRLYPVGRLDRDTTGLLLITNDGELTQKLCHPSFEIKKVYHVTLDKPLTKADFEKIAAGLELEDGPVKVDEMAYLEKKDELGLEIHSGRNRIVRRIFESLGYEVVKLDRVMYAGLTKKNLPRSKWRYLNEREIVLLKHFKS